MPAILFPLRCTGCGAYLQNAESAGPCPFCGAPAANSLRTVGVDPETMLVNEDVLCHHCNYNLRTSPVTGLCSKCGQPVSQSLGPDALRSADTDWIRKVRSGATIFLVFAILSILGPFLIPAVLGLGFSFMSASTVGGFELAVMFVGLAVWIVYLIGLFRITSGDPSNTHHESATPRALARVCAILPIALMPIFWIMAHQNPSALMTNPFAGMGRMLVICCVSCLIFGIGTAAVAACLRRIFARSFQHTSRKLSSVLIWLTVISTLGLSAGLVIQTFAMFRFVTSMGPAATMPALATAPSTVSSTTLGGSSYSYTTTTYRPYGTIVTTTGTTTAPAITPPSPKMLTAIFVPIIISCVSFLGALVCYVMWIIVLVRVRRLLAKRLAIGF